jgi:hypothetical protein
MWNANGEWRIANRERRIICERRDPLHSPLATRHSPAKREAGRVGSAEVVSKLRCLSPDNARVERAPMIGRLSRTGLGLVLLTPMETNRGP